MKHVPFVVDESPFICWDPDLSEKNLEYLRGIDAEYLTFVTQLFSTQLDGEEKQHAALGIRQYYSQGVETLFALLCSAVQAPQCTLGWMLAYRNRDLDSLVEKIRNYRPVRHRMHKNPSWDELSIWTHSHLDYEEAKKQSIQSGFGALWSKLAKDYLSEPAHDEYNSLKHGMRVSPGGFHLAMGKEDQFGKAAPPEQMMSFGGSAFGSAFFRRETMENAKMNFRPRRHHRNWSPQNLGYANLLVAMSIGNVVSALRILNGDNPKECKFENPADVEMFDKPWEILLDVTEFGIDSISSAKGIDKYDKSYVLESYEQQPSG